MSTGVGTEEREAKGVYEFEAEKLIHGYFEGQSQTHDHLVVKVDSTGLIGGDLSLGDSHFFSQGFLAETAELSVARDSLTERLNTDVSRYPPLPGRLPTG
jgi:hypothetical protein